MELNKYYIALANTNGESESRFDFEGPFMSLQEAICDLASIIDDYDEDEDEDFPSQVCFDFANGWKNNVSVFYIVPFCHLSLKVIKFTGKSQSEIEKSFEEFLMHDPTHEYDDDCEGCQPGMMDVKTGKQMEKNHPMMVAVLKAWKEKTTLAERRATSRVWMGQSTNPIDIEIMQRVGGMMQEAIKGVDDADEVHGSDE